MTNTIWFLKNEGFWQGEFVWLCPECMRDYEVHDSFYHYTQTAYPCDSCDDNTARYPIHMSLVPIGVYDENDLDRSDECGVM